MSIGLKLRTAISGIEFAVYVGMLLNLPACLAIALSLGAGCAVDAADTETANADRFDEIIEYRTPAAPTAVENLAPFRSNFSIAYGHCDDGTIEENGDITIDCKAKWSEVAWFNISSETVAGLVAEGKSSIEFQVSFADPEQTDNVRLSAHAESNGNREKVLSEPNLVHGDQVQLDLVTGNEYQIYVARGENNFLVWHKGLIELELAIRVATTAP